MLRCIRIALLAVALLVGCGAAETEQSGTSAAVSSPQDESRDEETPAETAVLEVPKPRNHYLPRRMTESREPDPKERFRVGDTEYYIFNPGLVVVSDTATTEYARRYRNMFTERLLENSHSIIWSVSYLEYWTRDRVAYYPVFTDEIPYAGGAAISRYYAEKLEEELAMGYNSPTHRFDHAEFVIQDFYAIIDLYSYDTYAVVFADPYLTVYTFGASLFGGVHDSFSLFAETFDMRTGQRLTTEDVFDHSSAALEHYSACLQEYAEYLDNFSGFGNKESYQNFALEEDAVVFIFNPYDRGAFSDGIRKIRVPYEALEPCLLIEPPFAAH